MSAKVGSLTGARSYDFWLVAGASILVWAAFKVFAPLQHQFWAVSRHFDNLPAFAGTASLLVNYPHFMVSYKLSYGQGFDFIKKFWWQLIAVPILLVATMASAWNFLQDPNLVFTPLSSYPWAQGDAFGRTIVGWLLSTMYFTVGWHYSKQMFGVMMVYAKYDSYKLTSMQRHIIKSALFGVWFVNYSSFTMNGLSREFEGIKYKDLLGPSWLTSAMWVLYLGSLLAFVYFVLIEKYRKDGQKPSATFLLPVVAFAIWWIPGLIQSEFYGQLVPFFHSLQYLCFVHKVNTVEARESGLREGERPFVKLGLQYIALVLVGWFAFEMAPSLLDHVGSPVQVSGLGFFYITLMIFINVHHYFIDNVLWRFQTSKVAQRLVQ